MVDVVEAVVSEPGLRERRKQATRHALELAALRLFARDGFDATTVEAIAAEADVSTRTFFRYFAAKEDVLNPLRSIRQERVREEVLADADADGQPGLLEIATEALCRLGADLESEPEVTELWSRAAASSVALRGRLYDVLRSWEATIAEALAQRSGLAADDPAVVAAAATTVSLWQRAVERWLRTGGSVADHLRALRAALA